MAMTGKGALVLDDVDLAGLVGREYLRVSFDKSGRERSNGEQQEDNRSHWPFTFGPHYSDAVSASRYATKERGDWKVLIADLEGDRFGANVLVLWESSRGSRKVGEWVELIELCEDRSVLIAVTEHQRIYDPANARDRRSLLEDAVDSEYESAKTSARAKRAQAANATAGRPHGKVPYGYRRRYDEVTRQLVAQEAEPAEAKVVVELFERLVAGHSLRSIAIDFKARGIRTRSGLVFSPEHLRNVALRDVYRGKRSHTVDSRNMGLVERKRNAKVTEAVWPRIVPERVFLAVQRILEDPARRTCRPGRARHLLSMIVRCDVCSGPLVVVSRPDERRLKYGCRAGGCVRVDKAQVDEIGEAAIIGYLSKPENVAGLVADEGNDEALAAARLEVEQIRTELDDLADKVGLGENNGGISATLAARAEPSIRERLRVAERREDELATPSALQGLIEPGDDVAERWDAAPMSAKRRIARLLLAPGVIGELRIARSPRRGRIAVPAIERVVWRTEKPDTAETADAATA